MVLIGDEKTRGCRDRIVLFSILKFYVKIDEEGRVIYEPLEEWKESKEEGV